MKLFITIAYVIIFFNCLIGQPELSISHNFCIPSKSLSVNRDKSQTELHIKPLLKNTSFVNLALFNKGKNNNLGLNLSVGLNKYHFKQSIYSIIQDSNEYYDNFTQFYSDNSNLDIKLKSIQFDFGLFRRFYIKNSSMNFDIGINLNYNRFFKKQLLDQTEYDKDWKSINSVLNINPKNNLSYSTYLRTNVGIWKKLFIKIDFNFYSRLAFNYYHKVDITTSYINGESKNESYQFGELNSPLVKHFNYIGLNLGVKYCF